MLEATIPKDSYKATDRTVLRFKVLNPELGGKPLGEVEKILLEHLTKAQRIEGTPPVKGRSEGGSNHHNVWYEDKRFYYSTYGGRIVDVFRKQ